MIRSGPLVRVEQPSDASHRGRVLIGDQDVSNLVIRAVVYVEADPTKSTVVLTLPLDVLAVSTDRAELDAPTKTMLRRLGWKKDSDRG